MSYVYACLSFSLSVSVPFSFSFPPPWNEEIVYLSVRIEGKFGMKDIFLPVGLYDDFFFSSSLILTIFFPERSRCRVTLSCYTCCLSLTVILYPRGFFVYYCSFGVLQKFP